MRGYVDRQSSIFVTLNLEEKVPQGHPLRAIKDLCDRIFVQMRGDFRRAYSRTGRPSIPPEQLLKALLLQALYSIRSEIQLMQAIDFNLLYRWFLDLSADEAVWTPETFSMNRERFAEHQLVRKFFDRIVSQAALDGLVSSDHFTVDGTLIESWASHKSLKPRDKKTKGSTFKDDDPGNPTVDYRGQKRRNTTHVSTTDPEARLAKKGPGKEAKLSHSMHVLMENRHGLCLDVTVDQADGFAERRNAKQMLKRVRRRHGWCPKTIGMDTGYEAGEFLAEIENEDIVPHIPIRPGSITADDRGGEARRRARKRMKLVSYEISQRVRKRVEEIIGWCKSVGGLARTRFVGRWKIAQEVLMVGAGYNLLRITRLQANAP